MLADRAIPKALALLMGQAFVRLILRNPVDYSTGFFLSEEWAVPCAPLRDKHKSAHYCNVILKTKNAVVQIVLGCLHKVRAVRMAHLI